jgi:hypothetical protein
MKIKLCDINTAALDMLKPEKNDRSGVGVHYMDAYLKPMKTVVLEDGTKFTARRRGLKVTIKLGTEAGTGLMRRLTVSKDPIVMLRTALDEATATLGVKLHEEDGQIFLEK